jgi:hypothetical protein
MYGTNDSYVVRDQKEPPLSVEQYRANLKELAAVSGGGHPAAAPKPWAGMFGESVLSTAVCRIRMVGT